MTELHAHRRVMLIAEDVATNRALLKKIFFNEFDIVEAADGEAALTALHTLAHVDVLLLDLAMPVKDGFAVLNEMHEDPRLAAIPVIVATVYDDEASRIRAFELGAADVFSKPYNAPLLRACVHNALKKTEQIAHYARLADQTELVRLAQHDALTGLYNRDAFCTAAGSLISSQPAGHYALLCFDVDGFKVINDQYGAEMGDRVLKNIAAYLNDFIASVGDGAACRMSADNFAALFPAERKLYVTAMAAEQASMLLHQGVHLSLQISGGRYDITDLSLPVSAMIDRALMAKRLSKGRYDVHVAHFSESMRKNVLEEQRITGCMEAALAADEFEPWLQPLFNNTTGAMCSAEVLVRWNQKTGDEPILPNAFIPVFERNGFIYELDKYIWERACKLIRAWLDEKIDPLPLAVNVSRSDLLHHDFYEVVTSLVERYRIPVSLLRLEITESAFAEATSLLVDVVKRLRKFGFIIEIDDFGSGYSSFNTLKNVPADVLKLDMRFLEDTEGSQRGGNILESIVRMTRWLGMSVIAEGVETREQADFLRSIGCYVMQGYLYANPMPPEEFEALMTQSDRAPEDHAIETLRAVNADAFWNPQSIETLIFNTYVGGACVLEMDSQKAEIVRVNDRYLEAIRTTLPPAEVLTRDPMETFTKEDGERFFQQVAASAKTGEEFHGEVWKHLIADPAPHAEYIRYTGRVIAQSGSRRIVYLLVENITGQKQAEERMQAMSEQLSSIMENVSSGICAYIIGPNAGRVLFANDRYYQLFGYTRKQFSAEIVNTLDYIYGEDRARIEAIDLKLLKEGGRETFDYRCIRRDGQIIWMRCTAAAVRISGCDFPVLLTETTDITEQKRAEQERLHTETMLRDSAEQLQFLNETARVLLTEADTADAMQRVLKQILIYFNGDRAYVHELDGDGRSARNTYEVCLEGVAANLERLQQIPQKTMDDWNAVFERDGRILISADAATGADDGGCAVIAVPLRRDGRLIGVMGVDNPRQKVSHADHMLALGDYMAVILTRRDYEKKLSCDNETLVQMMQDMPGGYVQMKLQPEGGIIPIFTNDEFCRMSGMTRTEIFKLYGQNAYAGVHPDDVAITHETLTNAIAGKATVSLRLRLIRGDGGYVPVQAFYRVTDDAAGNCYINGYYTDISSRLELERRYEELLDNLPCGAAIYEFADGKLSVGYLNKRFRMTVGRDGDEIRQQNSITAVHPEDRAGLIRAMQDAAACGDTMEHVTRILNGDGGYTAFRIVGHVVRREGSNLTIYVTFFPISEETRLVRQMLADAVQNIPAGIGIYEVHDDDVRPVYVSDNVCDMFGFSREEYNEAAASGEAFLPIRQLFQSFPHDVLHEAGTRYENVVEAHRGNGERFWVRVRTITRQDGDDLPILYCTLADVTDSVEAEKRSRLQAERYRLLADILEPVLADYDADADVMTVVSYHTDGEPTERVFRDFRKHIGTFDVIHIDNRLEFARIFSRMMQSPCRNTSVYRADFGRGMRWYRARYSSIADETGHVYRVISMSEDIHLEQLAHLRLIERAETDPVTGLMNRASAAEILHVQLQQEKHSGMNALFMIDIDNFKQVNDRYGHQEGDAALKAFAEILKSSFRNADVICRFGGDEFVVFMPSCGTVEIAQERAQRLVDETARVKLPGGAGLQCSIGIVVTTKEAVDADTLLMQADYALYESKHGGKNRFTLFDPSTMSGKVSDLGNWRERD